MSMPRQTTFQSIRWTLADEDETDVEVWFDFTPGEPPSGHFEHYDPGSGPEVSIHAVYRDGTNTKIQITPTEHARITSHLYDNFQFSY